MENLETECKSNLFLKNMVKESAYNPGVDMLSKEKIEYIETMTQDLISDCYSGQEIMPPIDLDKIIKTSGLTVKFGNFLNQSIDGAFDRKQKIIFLSESAPYNRKVFTAAHELGHFYLHKNVPTEIFYRSDLFGDLQKSEEQEANWFASCLLMPRYLVKRFWLLSNNVDDIARRFSVSSSAAYFRLKNLELIP